MSIDEAKPEEWDGLKYFKTDGPNFKPEDFECLLPANHRQVMQDDAVNKPLHYRVGEVEAIDYIAQQLGSGVKDYLLGNIHKYLHRHRFKNGLEDLRKARWYLDKLIYEEVQGGMDGES